MLVFASTAPWGGSRTLLGRAGKKMLQPMVDTHLNYIEAELAAWPWFSGQTLTAAYRAALERGGP
jgi:hypothetical protein